MIVIIMDYTMIPSTLLKKYFPIGTLVELKNERIYVDRCNLPRRYFKIRELTEEETLTYRMLYPTLNWGDYAI